MKQNRMCRLALVLVCGTLTWPSTAAGKQGAICDSQLIVPVGYATLVQVYVLPVHRGAWEMPSVPRVGSVPVVTLRPLSGQRVRAHRGLRFIGTPLDRRLRSLVWITAPGPPAVARWEVYRVSVRAGGHVYPDLVDSSLSNDCSAAGATSASDPLPIPPPSAASGDPGGDSPAALFALGAVALAAAGGGFALTRTLRAGRRLRRGPGR